MERYDVLVVGGGHNGLTCAAYLAKAGRNALVPEARETVGGGCANKEAAPLEKTTEGLGLMRQNLSAPNHVARQLFETPEVQTWIGFWVAQLAGTGDVFGLGANYPVMLAGSLEPFGWAICEGGSNQLAQAMVGFLEDHGGEIRLGASVVRIEVERGLARAVELADGTRIPVPGILVSNLDPRHTFLDLVGEEELAEDFARACRRWRY